MIKTTTFRGDIEDDDHVNIHGMSGEDYMGVVLCFSHPSGPIGGAMGRVFKVEENDGNDVVTAVDVLTGNRYRKEIGSYPPCVSLPAIDAEYRVYCLEHLNGSKDWVRTTPWSSSQYSVKYWYGEYEGHEPTRVKYKKAIYVGDGDLGINDEQVDIYEGTVKVDTIQEEQ